MKPSLYVLIDTFQTWIRDYYLTNIINVVISLYFCTCYLLAVNCVSYPLILFTTKFLGHCYTDLDSDPLFLTQNLLVA